MSVSPARRWTTVLVWIGMVLSVAFFSVVIAFYDVFLVPVDHWLRRREEAARDRRAR